MPEAVRLWGWALCGRSPRGNAWEMHETIAGPPFRLFAFFRPNGVAFCWDLSVLTPQGACHMHAYSQIAAHDLLLVTFSALSFLRQLLTFNIRTRPGAYPSGSINAAEQLFLLCIPHYSLAMRRRVSRRTACD